LARTVIEDVVFDDDLEAMVVSVRPRKGAQRRCGRCGRRAAWYDRGGGRRRWRALDVGTTRVWLEADAPRVNCPVHGPTVIQVPWARHGAGHTRDFDETIAWLAVRCSKTAVTELMRIAWRTVGSILTRVQADLDAGGDRLTGLRRIGIDEISYKRGHRYLIVVVDHDTGALVWAAPGRDQATLRRFFDDLGPDRAAAITHVSADGADWAKHVLAERCPQAVLCLDPFHVVAWATEALDEVRRAVWNEARGGRPQHQVSRRRAANQQHAHPLRRVRFALWKNPDTLTPHQRQQLDWIATSHPRVWRAYLLKEGLRYVFAVKGDDGKEALDQWLAWASRSRLAAFVELARRVRRHRAAIDATLEHSLSNALVESTNTKIRLLTRVAFGFHGPQPLIALTMLALGPTRPALPGRT
jgi:transposase